MAVSFVSASQGGVAGAGTLTISHTVASGSDRALLVIVQTIAADNASGGSATWRSASMGSSVLSHWGGANAATYAWLLVAPEVGSGNVVITFNSGSTFANAVVLSFDGVDQSTPVSATATYNDTFATSPRSLSITTPADGACADMLYVANAGTTMTPTGSGQSAAGSKMVNSGVWSLAGSYRTGAASVMDWTFSGGSFAAVQGAVALNPSSGGGGSTPIEFSGTVPTLTGQVGVSFSEDIGDYFDGTETPFSFAVQSGTLPAGLSLNSSTGVISGTPTTAGTASGIVIRGTDAESDTDDTNSFSIVIDPAPATSMTIALKQSDGTTAAASVTGIEYAILNAATVAAATAVLDTGTGESTDGSGNLVLDITGLGLTAGQIRYVVAGKSNGTPGGDFDGWHGPATAA